MKFLLGIAIGKIKLQGRPDIREGSIILIVVLEMSEFPVVQLFSLLHSKLNLSISLHYFRVPI